MIAAIDCDLRKIYCVTDRGEVLAKADPSPDHVAALLCAHNITTVLFEIASAVDYTDSKSVAHNKRRWSIWNVAAAARLDALRGDHSVLVAPSSAWTRGFDLFTRHRMAGCTQKQKDLRECEAMIWFYKQHPWAWKSLGEYLEMI